ncbi:MAG: PEP-CTERM sorting domain-containing protein [Pirellulales bacterium]
MTKTDRPMSLLCALIALAMCSTAMAHPGGLNTPSPDLPPIIVPGVYLSPSDVHAKYSGPALEIVLSMVEHQPFAELDPDDFQCGAAGTVCDEHHHFQSDLHAMVSINGDAPFPIIMQGPVRTVAFGKGPTDTTGTFDTEMLSMSLTGGGVMVRESPTKASTGKTSIADIGGGMYHIDSFFDVFTELSLDGGASWIPKAGPRGTRVHLGGVPEPSAIMLAGLSLIGLAGFVRRRK